MIPVTVVGAFLYSINGIAHGECDQVNAEQKLNGSAVIMTNGLHTNKVYILYWRVL